MQRYWWRLVGVAFLALGITTACQAVMSPPAPNPQQSRVYPSPTGPAPSPTPTMVYLTPPRR
ncbi:MAG: hypothetical protein KatS3mg061_0732 [Dehalococcoidia bacterium]|nr:MAG: hypothetical protein KatS3mg061_0732 [Dehalococcoidia bacterium]